MPGPSPSNRLRDALDAGETAIVLASQAMSTDLVDLLGQTGAHGVWLEGEHGAVAWDRVGDLSRAAELWGLAAVLRIPAFAPWRVARALSLGAHAVVLPQVAGADEARAFAAAARFSPHGTRGVNRGRRSYGRPEFFAEEAVSPVTVVQVEHVDGLEQLDAICAVRGLDVVFIAPNDLADSMGHLGRPDHPDVTTAVEDGLRRIRDLGKIAGTSTTSERFDDLVAAGARFLYVSVDGWMLAGAAELLHGRPL